jgi:hypothetical protein
MLEKNLRMGLEYNSVCQRSDQVNSTSMMEREERF